MLVRPVMIVARGNPVVAIAAVTEVDSEAEIAEAVEAAVIVDLVVAAAEIAAVVEEAVIEDLVVAAAADTIARVVTKAAADVPLIGIADRLRLEIARVGKKAEIVRNAATRVRKAAEAEIARVGRKAAAKRLVKDLDGIAKNAVIIRPKANEIFVRLST